MAEVLAKERGAAYQDCMRAFGYARHDESSETPTPLREVSLACGPEELESLVAFLEHVRAEVRRRGPGPLAPCHFHLHDFDRTARGGSDLIVVLGVEPTPPAPHDG